MDTVERRVFPILDRSFGKTPRTEPWKRTFTTASGLLPAGIAIYVQRGPNGVVLEMGYPVGLEDLYVSMGERPIEFTTASLGNWRSIENKQHWRLWSSF